MAASVTPDFRIWNYGDSALNWFVAPGVAMRQNKLSWKTLRRN
jgi:hypothetical protein